MNNTKSLAVIAADMIATANTGGTATIHLNKGLSLRLTVTGTNHQLSLTRPDVTPSKSEIDVCRRYFSIPQAAKAKSLTINRNDTTFHIVRLNWTAPLQSTQITMFGESTATANNYQE